MTVSGQAYEYVDIEMKGKGKRSFVELIYDGYDQKMKINHLRI